MRRITGLMLGLILFVGAGRAYAQALDCSGGCTTTKYGLGLKPDYRKDEVPPDPFRYDVSYFGPSFGGQSYFVSRTPLVGSNGSCGPKRSLSPLPGQIILTDQNCAPTSSGPSCTAGANTGDACHLPTLNLTCTGAGAPLGCCTAAGKGACDGFATSAPNSVECGAGGTCSQGAGTGCRVEIKSSDGGYTAPADTTEVRIFTLTFQATAPNGDQYNLSASTGNTIGGTSFDGTWGLSVSSCTAPGVPAACCTGPGTGSCNTCTAAGVPAACCTGPGTGTCQPLTPCTLSSGATQGNVRRRATTGTRYILPANRGGNGTVAGGTYIRWDSDGGLATASFTDLATGFRVHTDDSAVCCAANNPTLNSCSSAVPPSTPNYPLLTVRTCGLAGRFVNEDNIVPDWIFAGGRGTAFHTDDDFVLPGTIPGTCRVNEFTSCYNSNANLNCAAAGVNFLGGALACCTGPGTGTCTANSFCASNGQPFACCTGAGAGTCADTCPTLDADPNTAGLQPDSCDLRSPGPRVQVGPGARDANNNARFDYCGGSLYVMRGTPNQHCAVLPRAAYNGDPGPDCGVVNYGVDHRNDDNCDGVGDNPDLCPRNSEWNQILDTDGDCGTPGSQGFPRDACRGDECECGDQGGTGTSGTEHIGNGVVNVSDIVAINNSIFGSQTRLRLCDANGDTNCNVSDIVSANKEIFTPDSSICRQITPRQCGAKFCTGGTNPGAACTTAAQCLGGGTCPWVAVGQPCCGNGIHEFSEGCDDGNVAPGDGCNPSCRVEFGFVCDPGTPEVCHH